MIIDGLYIFYLILAILALAIAIVAYATMRYGSKTRK